MLFLEKYLVKIINVLITSCFAVMTTMVFINVVMRYVFNSGIAFSEELSRFCFVWMTFLGAILAMKEHSHIRVDTLIRHLSHRGKKVCAAISNVLMIYISWLLFDGSLTQTIINFGTRSPATGFSMAMLYGVGVICSVGIIIYALRNLYQLHKNESL
ncbi:TRAP transporter small permease [Pectobacterium sp. B1J-3]|uniref:TRAP transporter small permease n=1 Tax=Pectobacterium sp. B1J-3 TaxID=3385371 RepID=UPI0039069B63